MNTPTSTAVRREALREALIEAAERRIAANGYAALRARDVAADVGCAIGAIYLVFSDLDALITAVEDRTLDALDREAALATAQSPADVSGLDERRRRAEAAKTLKALARLYLRFARGNRNLWRALFEHRPRAPDAEAMPPKLDSIFVHVERQLDVLAPSMSKLRRRRLAEAVLSAVHGVVTLGLENNFGRKSEAEIAWQTDQILDLVARGLARDEASG